MKVYTDGATSNNGYEGAIGGWAYIALSDDLKEHFHNSGFIKNATNNICELSAALYGCEAVAHLSEKHIIYSDSAYLVNCYKEKWYKKWQKNGWINSSRQPVKNKELWEKLIPYFEDERFSFERVPGHAGNKWNEEADRLAVEAKLKK